MKRVNLDTNILADGEYDNGNLVGIELYLEVNGELIPAPEKIYSLLTDRQYSMIEEVLKEELNNDRYEALIDKELQKYDGEE